MAAPTSPSAPPHEPPALAALLRDVSRSFGLSIRLLPPPLRAPMTVAYLLARATDTVADTLALPTTARLMRLEALRAAVADGTGQPWPPAEGQAIAAHLQDPGERALMRALPEVLAAFGALPEADRADIRAVLGPITDGQRQDIERFERGAALADAAELDRYCWQVAGCVGEFWTALCLRHQPGYASLPAEALMPLARRFGQGLQLVNILRDVGPDLAAGRCYLPADELRAAGADPLRPAADPKAFEAVHRAWRARARACLRDAARYVQAVGPARLRAAVALPALLGLQTLNRLDAAGPAVLHRHVKVPRAQVWRLLAALALTGAARGPLAARLSRLVGSARAGGWDNAAP